MKNYELIQKLLEFPAGADIIVQDTEWDNYELELGYDKNTKELYLWIEKIK